MPLLAAAAFVAACDSPVAPAPEPVNPAPPTAPPEVFPRPTVLPPAIPPSAWQAEQAVAVDLAVHQFQFRETRLPPRPLIYFLADSTHARPWTNPSQELLRLFAGHEPPVKPFSACRVDPTSLEAVVDVATGAQGVVFRVGPRSWVSETEVHVVGGHYYNGIGAAENTYVVRYERRRWVVVHVRHDWIS